MNTAILTTLLALASFAPAATLAAECFDIGDGYLCAEADENGADIELYLEGTEAKAANECHDLAGFGHACAEADEHGADFEIVIEGPAVAASQDCQDIGEYGYLCAEADEDGADIDLYIEI